MEENIVVAIVNDARDVNGNFTSEATFSVTFLDESQPDINEMPYSEMVDNKQYYLDDIVGMESNIAAAQAQLDIPDFEAHYQGLIDEEQSKIDNIDIPAAAKWGIIIDKVGELV